ncbi:PREDICTED: prominin-2-like [Acropora digitifera]|uniref:prominin-2-like n=1 Tax=Acropora digitifera TaxID=70779 RepID=UPI00077A00D5|nr:PREDICTED: prominin-2-like [Acropora digitifera]
MNKTINNKRGDRAGEPRKCKIHENTLTELSEVTGENMNFTIGLISQELSFLPVNISTPLIQRAQQSVDTLLNDVREMGFKLTDLRDSLKEISQIVLNLRNLGQRLRAGLNEARDNLTAAKEECTNDPPSVQAGACDKIPSWDDLQAEADFNQVPDATKELSNIEAILSKNDFEAQATQGSNTFNSIPAKVYEVTYSGSQEITNFSKELQYFASEMVNSLRKDADSIQNNILIPMKGEVQSLFGKGGSLNRYDKYRWMLLLSISLAVVFVVLLTFLAVISGALGASPSDTPSTRSDTSNCAGRALMCVAGLYFFFAFFVNFLLAVTFFVGANSTVLCKSATDLSLLENVSNLRCNQHETPWELLRLDRKFKFENMKTYKSKIPSLDEILMKLNDTLISIRLVSEDTRKAVNDTFSSGAQEIEYYKYSAEAAKPLLKNDLNLATFANDLETAAAEQVSASVAEKLRSTKSALNTLDDETVKTSQPLVVGLTPKSQLSMTKNMNAMPIFIRRDSNKAFQWRIRNLPYPVNVYSVTVNEDNTSITIRTSNKKYFKRFDIPDMERAQLKLDQGAISVAHANNTLIITEFPSWHRRNPGVYEDIDKNTGNGRNDLDYIKLSAYWVLSIKRTKVILPQGRFEDFRELAIQRSNEKICSSAISYNMSIYAIQ